MKKLFYVVLSQGLKQPKLIKTSLTLEKYRKEYQDLKVQEFQSENDALLYLQQSSKTPVEQLLPATNQKNLKTPPEQPVAETNQASQNHQDNRNIEFVITKQYLQEEQSQPDNSPHLAERIFKNYYKINDPDKFETLKKEIVKTDTYNLFFDGASQNNPGLSGAGYLIYDKNSKKVFSNSLFIGTKTNNQAEYLSIIFGLKSSLDLGITNLECFGDSKLVIMQLLGKYKVKNENIAPFFKIAQSLSQKFQRIDYNHIKRELNTQADKLSVDAIRQRNSIYQF